MERATICYTEGPRQSEQSLLADVKGLLDALEERVLAQPILIIVPSNSLRTHLLTRLAKERGRAIAGLTYRPVSELISELGKLDTP